jgi:hypothetical protein
MTLQIYENFINQIWENDFSTHPLPENTLIELVIVEPRQHHLLCNILKHFSFMFPYCALTVIHSKYNHDFIYNMIGDFKNITKIELFDNNININTYNNLLKSYNFYKLFKSEFILIFQTDTGIIYNNILHFLQFDYVGAPWKNNYGLFGKPVYVGNGGLSLRKVKTMLEICSVHNNGINFRYNEDVFIANCVNHSYNLPSVEIAKLFSNEIIFNDLAMGFHKFYNYQNINNINLLFSKCNIKKSKLEILNVNNDEYLLKYIKSGISCNGLYIKKGTLFQSNSNLNITYKFTDIDQIYTKTFIINNNNLDEDIYF